MRPPSISRRTGTRGLSALALLALVPGQALGAQTPTLASAPSIALPLTHDYTFRSRVNGEEYRLHVVLPLDYRPDSVKYNTMYVLWGGAPMLATMYRPRAVDNRLILIGVALPATGTRAQYELTPGPYTPADSVRFRANADTARMHFGDRPPTVGGAGILLRVLREEIIPLVERTFPVTSDRGLMGHSTAAVFTLFALFDSPDLFSRFSITSPGPNPIPSLLAREADLWSRRPELAKRVFFAVGSRESARGQSATAAVVDRLRSRNYPGLQLAVETLADEGHNSPVFFWRALQWLYPDQAVRR